MSAFQLPPCIIPARGGSRGIPRKNIVELGGKPLIAWSIEAAKNSHSVGEIFVSTEDEEIAEIAQSCGALIINRPIELATDNSTSESALRHALEFFDTEFSTLPEFFVFIQCTSPLISPIDVDAVVEKLQREEADSVIAVQSGTFFLWRRKNGSFVEAVNHDPSVRLPRQLAEQHFCEAGAVYAVRSERFLTENTRYCGKIELYEMPRLRALEIDEPSDLELVRAVISAGL